MIQHQWFAALVLVKAAQGIITKRRNLEMMCGYDPEYGGDELLLKRINEFLDDTHIEHEVKDAMEFVKVLNKKT